MSESETAQQQERSSGQLIAAWVLIPLLAYAFSFGPMIFLLVKLPWLGGRQMERVIQIAYFPHIWLAENWQPYMDYAEWWAKLAV